MAKILASTVYTCYLCVVRYPIMAKRLTIKEIAEKAGVSSGTVDRVLHGRGKVSERSRVAVEHAIAAYGKVGENYYPANARPLLFAVVTPTSTVGDYWSSIHAGIERGLQELSYLGIIIKFFHYNQFDLYSCLAAYDAVLEQKPDAVLVGPTFTDETKQFCTSLDALSIPYVFVDSQVNGTHPLASFCTDQIACGKVAARLLTACTNSGGKIALFESRRSQTRLSVNSQARRDGFLEYLREIGREQDLIETCYTEMIPSENKQTIKNLLSKYKDLQGIAVLNSRGSAIAEALELFGAQHIWLLSFDLTNSNGNYLRSGVIRALVCQRPVRQGYLAITTLANYIIQNIMPEPQTNYMPIDIVLPETLDIYREE